MPYDAATLFSGNIQVFIIDSAGNLYVAYGDDKPTSLLRLGDGFIPGVKPTLGRVWPDPANPFYKFIWVSGAKKGGGIRTYRTWDGNQSGQWFGPFDAA